MNSLLRTPRLLAAFAATCLSAFAGTIEWSVPVHSKNLDSTGLRMDSGFIFELGVFSSGFQPTASNIVEWEAHWRAADSAQYNAHSDAFASICKVPNNLAPFTAGVPGWIMGSKVTSTGTEKILFRRTTWTWPAADLSQAPSTFQREWSVSGESETLQVVLASVEPKGNPHTLKSSVIRNYGQWKKLQEGQVLSGEGEADLLSFVFDTGRPEDRGRPPFTPISKVRVNGQDHLQIEIPRNRAHLARLNVQVSSDLVNWVDGASHTEVVTDGPFGLVVRDKTPASVHNGKRFMRVQIEPEN